MICIATHQRPDADALVATWLVSRFLFDGQPSQVQFVPRDYVPDGEGPYDCVVDVGCRYDPFRLLFDHKPPAVADRHSTCASRMVWEYLLARGDDVAHLAELIDAVHDGDSIKRRNGSLAYRQSQKDGLHAFIKTQQKRPDKEIMHSVSVWLDANHSTKQVPGHLVDSRWELYSRGRVYLHSLEARDNSLQCRSTLTSQAWRVPGFLAWDKSWQVANELGEVWGINREAVKQAAIFALVVDRIRQACGNSDFHATLSGVLFKTQKDILTVGRRESERIKFAVEQVRLGKPPMKARPPGIFDTADFKKVTSRLGRAEGAIRVSVELLRAGFKHNLVRTEKWKRVDVIESDLALIESNLPKLRKAMRVVETREDVTKTKPKGKQRKTESKRKRKTFNIRLLVTFSSILITNLPRLPERALPTREQKEYAIKCLGRIERLVKELREAWSQGHA